MFTMTPGEVSDRVVSILKERVAAGVEVRMIVDRYGAKVNDKSEAIFEELTAAGVEVVVNDIFPIDRDGLLGDRSFDPWQDEVGNADHRKMLVIDGKIGWIGGAGFEDHFYGGSYHDAYVRVTGDVVRQMQLVYLTSFHALGGPPPASGLDRYFPVPDAPGAIPATLLHNVPGGFLPGTQAIGEVIEQSQERLDILNPYLTDPDMIDRIIDAGERGVDVTVVLPGDSNVTQARDAAEHNYGDLFDAGVEVYEHETIIHAKVICRRQPGGDRHDQFRFMGALSQPRDRIPVRGCRCCRRCASGDGGRRHLALRAGDSCRRGAGTGCRTGSGTSWCTLSRRKGPSPDLRIPPSRDCATGFHAYLRGTYLFSGDIVPAMEELVASGPIRVIGHVVNKDAGGENG